MRRSPPVRIATNRAAPRLACVKPVASVHPEPGSNSSLLLLFLFNLFRPGRLLTYSVQAVSFIDGVQFTFFCLYFLFSCLCKSYSKNSSFFRKRGAKVMLFYLYLQIFSEVFSFFSDAFGFRLGSPTSPAASGISYHYRFDRHLSRLRVQR